MLYLILQIGTGLLIAASIVLVWATYRVQKNISLQLKKKTENPRRLSAVVIPPQGHNVINFDQFRAVTLEALVREWSDRAKVGNHQGNSIPVQSNTNAGSNLVGESSGKFAASAR